MFEKLTLKTKNSSSIVSSLTMLFLFAVMFLGFNPIIAHGQGSYGADPTSFLGTVMQSTMSNANQIVQNQLMKKYLEQSLKKKSTPARQYGNTNIPSAIRPGKSPANNQNTSSATIFKPVSSSIMPQKISAQMGNDPDKRQQNLELMKMFLDQYTKTFQNWNGPRNDLAQAFTFFISTSYAVVTGNRVEKEQFRSAYQQVQAVLLQSSKLPNLSDREKQEMYEGLIIMSSYPVYFSTVANDASAANQAKAKQLNALAKEIAKDNLERLFGSSYKNIKFTEYGIDF